MMQSAIELFYKSICGADDAELVSHFPFSILILVFNFYFSFVVLNLAFRTFRLC